MSIPKEVQSIIKEFQDAGYEAHIVGGCVRDILRNAEPEDWDVATNANPEEIQKIFPKSFYSNKFFTVTVQTGSQNPRLKEIEITTYRLEAKYTDKRHPDEIKFAKTIKEDLSRRDFTVNAMALQLTADNKQQATREKEPLRILRGGKTAPAEGGKRAPDYNPPTTLPSWRAPTEGVWSEGRGIVIIDPFGGREDLKNKIIRAVGEPKKRFSEDALRLLRAVRFATTLGKNWKIEPRTLKAIKGNAAWLRVISKERIRDEIEKIIMSPRAYEGFLLLHQTNLSQYLIPELEKGVGITQNRHHIYTIFQHSLLSLKYAARYNYNLAVRLAALFHDIAKPQTKRGEGLDATFYNHDVVGAKIAMGILSRLKFPKKLIEKVGILIRYHMFYYDPEIVSESSVRRLLNKVGPENIGELIQLRIADRKGSGVPKAKPYRLRHFEYIVSKVSRHPISVEMLKINGHDVMKILNIEPGPRVGLLLNALLSEVLDNPSKNKKDYLKERARELRKLTNEELKKMEKEVEEKKEEIEIQERVKFHI